VPTGQTSSHTKKEKSPLGSRCGFPQSRGSVPPVVSSSTSVIMELNLGSGMRACTRSINFLAPSCTPDADGCYYIWLCRVAMGPVYNYTQTGMPPRSEWENRRMAPPGYESVLSNGIPTTYREHVVYDRHQTYPEFLLRYRRTLKSFFNLFYDVT